MCSAKQLVKGEPNVSYICSRYYRAPELIFGATDYTTQIGLWLLNHCSCETTAADVIVHTIYATMDRACLTDGRRRVVVRLSVTWSCDCFDSVGPVTVSSRPCCCQQGTGSVLELLPDDEQWTDRFITWYGEDRLRPLWPRNNFIIQLCL